MTIEEATEIGRKWGEILQMKRHRDEHGTPISPSWSLTTGWKTSLGLFRTICNMADEARGVDIEKLKAERDELRAALEVMENVVGHNSCTDGKTPNGFTVALDRARSVLAKVERSSNAKSNSQTR